MRLRLDQRVTDLESVAKHVIHGAAHGRHASAHGGREGAEIVLLADRDYMVHGRNLPKVLSEWWRAASKPNSAPPIAPQSSGEPVCRRAGPRRGTEKPEPEGRARLKQPSSRKRCRDRRSCRFHRQRDAALRLADEAAATTRATCRDTRQHRADWCGHA